MNNLPEKATVMETQSQQQEMRWFTTMIAFLDIPNPAIFKVFVISCLATFALGFALAIEWLVHGRSHTGFEWIIYYALFLVCLPLLIWFGLHIFMVISCSSHSSSQIVDSIAVKEPPCTDVSEGTEETEKNNSRSLAVVVESDERKNKDEKMPRIKRAVSFPSHGKVRSCRTR
ncbi:hypothetical protein AALP_AA6G304400 [Arabis alpina]|uniref:Transmembrane protein n=1 Tax=Arabis alpina TaxID=50452 RepID=A0A087GSQ5_ARAAL|nr:hypothetical protein AALP_AA6G304400 [Arabis alpina]